MAGVAAAVVGVIGAISASESASDATAAQVAGGDKAIAATQQSIAEARQELKPRFAEAEQRRRQGTQQALDVFSQTLGRSANIPKLAGESAQWQLRRGAEQAGAAILGGPIDYGQLQPMRASFNSDAAFATPEVYNSEIAAQLGVGRGNLPVSDPPLWMTTPGHVPGIPATGGDFGSGQSAGAAPISPEVVAQLESALAAYEQGDTFTLPPGFGDGMLSAEAIAAMQNNPGNGTGLDQLSQIQSYIDLWEAQQGGTEIPPPDINVGDLGAVGDASALSGGAMTDPTTAPAAQSRAQRPISLYGGMYDIMPGESIDDMVNRYAQQGSTLDRNAMLNMFTQAGAF